MSVFVLCASKQQILSFLTFAFFKMLRDEFDNLSITNYPLLFSRSILSKVEEVYLPLVWFETIAGLPSSDAAELKTLLYIMNSPIVTIIFSVMVGLGLLTIILVLVYHYQCGRRT